MKTRKFLLLLPAGIVLSGMLMSCTSHLQPRASYSPAPVVFPSTTNLAAAPMKTSISEMKVKGDQGGMLKMWLDPDNNKCTVTGDKRKKGKKSQKNPINCSEAGAELKTEMYFCGPADEVGHPANEVVNGASVYCGKILFLPEGTDIQFLSDRVTIPDRPKQKNLKNAKCKVIGGRAICY